MGLMVVANTGSVPRGETANISLVEISEDPETPLATPSSLQLIVPISEASNYVVGTQWRMSLSKVTPVAGGNPNAS